MDKKTNLPEWMKEWITLAIKGEIHPNLRAVVASFSEQRELQIRYYLDRPPTQEDWESLDCVVTCIFANTNSADDIKSVKQECEYSALPLDDLDPLGGFIYRRSERN